MVISVFVSSQILNAYTMQIVEFFFCLSNMPLTKRYYNLNNSDDVEEIRRFLQDNDD